MEYRVFQTNEFEDWIENETVKSQVQIADRIDKIRSEGHFGDHKQVRDDIWELRWKNGRRIYYSIIPESQLLLLLGGNKNGQTKDINQAQKIYHEWIDD